jgi:hypothetical protein
MFDDFTGDATGLAIPAHPEALRAAGAAFLTRAFRTFGALSPDNQVTAITALEPCPGGSTGAKLFLEVSYARPSPDIPERLFVKFSRDFADARRDERGRWEMASEARFAPLTRAAGFPIAAPRAMFADYRSGDGSGLIITERVLYGEGAIEPHRRKCLDHLTLAEPLPHYREVVTALARLAAAHKSGALAGDIAARFPFDPAHGSADPIRYDAAALDAELAHCFAYARDCPQLLPDAVRSPEFEAGLARDAQLIRANEARIQHFLTGDDRMIALCHWNAHIDNGWFWRDPAGALHCGLIDWGRAGQITFGAALWGCLSAAHHDIWDYHLEALLALFANEYRVHGGPAISPDELLYHLRVHMATMGVARVLAFPEIIRFRMPDCAKLAGTQDPALEPVALDPARNSMHIYAVFCKFWHKYDAGGAVHELLGRAQ